MVDSATAPQGSSDSRRRRDRQGASWIVGAALVLLGVVFFLEQNGYVVLTGNWWALFIYLAAIAAFANMWRSYRASGWFGPQATGSLVWGLVLLVVATIFLLNLLWELWWPAILIAVGAGIIGGSVLGNITRKPESGGTA